MFFCRLTTEKLYFAQHTRGLWGMAASWGPLWQRALIAGKGSQEWVFQVKCVKTNIFTEGKQYVSEIHQPLPPLPFTLINLRSTVGPAQTWCEIRLAEFIRSEFGSTAGLHYSIGVRKHLEENIMRWPCSFAHFLHCIPCSILELTDSLRTGTVSHLLPSLQCWAQGLLGQGLTQSRCQVHGHALKICWVLAVCQALCWGLIIGMSKNWRVRALGSEWSGESDLVGEAALK